MYVCKYCSREFIKCNSLYAHMSHCKQNPNKTRTYENCSKRAKLNAIKQKQIRDIINPIIDYEFVCKKCGSIFYKSMRINTYNSLLLRNKLPTFCKRVCANSREHTIETKNKIRETRKKFDESHVDYWLFGRPKKEDKIYKCKYCDKNYILKDGVNKTFCSKQCRSIYLSKNTGGYRKGSGVGKQGRYKGIWCDSSWELAFVIYHLDNGLRIERCNERRIYFYNNQTHIYIPDFITDYGIIEIKGYKSKQWESKLEQNKDIKVLYEKEMQYYIDYTIKKYGKDYIKLYEHK